MEEIKNIKSLVNKFLSNNNQKKIGEALIKSKWEEIMPYAINIRTKKIKLIDQKLFIEIDSPSLRHELQIMKEGVLKKLNNAKFISNINVIEDIIFC